jgi:PTH1 family peptidyl-tRNA hydrolase
MRLMTLAKRAMSRLQKTKALQLIVGLGNPGPTYANTRHNVGAVWVETLAAGHGIVLREDPKYHGLVGRGEVADQELRLLVPTTYMNLSGDAVAAIARFFKLEASEILVAHDELAFEPGQVRLKTGGGINGHNGLRDIIPKLANNDRFHRLRIGVGHPGAPDKVASYLTSARIPDKEREKIEDALNFKPSVLKSLVRGDISRAMNSINTKPPKPVLKEKTKQEGNE